MKSVKKNSSGLHQLGDCFISSATERWIWITKEEDKWDWRPIVSHCLSCHAQEKLLLENFREKGAQTLKITVGLAQMANGLSNFSLSLREKRYIHNWGCCSLWPDWVNFPKMEFQGQKAFTMHYRLILYSVKPVISGYQEFGWEFLIDSPRKIATQHLEARVSIGSLSFS